MISYHFQQCSLSIHTHNYQQH